MTRQRILLLEKISLTILFTLLIISLTKKIWRQGSEHPISVAFTVEAPKGTDIEVFWTESPDQSFSPQRAQSICTKESAERLVFSLPAHKRW